MRYPIDALNGQTSQGLWTNLPKYCGQQQIKD
jgi:hypothetical protein